MRPQRPGGTNAEIVFDSVRQFIGLLAPDGRLLDANASSLEAAGVRREDVVGRPFWETAWWRSLDEAQARLRDAIAEAARGSSVRYDVIHRGQGGAGFLVADFSLTPFRDGEGRVVYLVAEGRDITDRKRAEDEVLRQRHELGEAKERLERERDLRQDLVRAASHDLRGPLQVVALQARLLRERLSGPDQESNRRSAEVIVGAARRMTAMLQDLVDSDTLQHAGVELSRRAIAVEPLVSNLLSIAAGALDVGRIRLALPRDLPAVDADPARLERILLNLIENALKYTEGEVLVAASSVGPDVCFRVSDGGPGIPSEDLTRVFDRFYRGRRGKLHDGLGLGLYIVRMLVEAHGGRVSVTSGSSGTEFTFTLPVSRAT